MTGERITALDKVRALIERLAPEPLCDDCIAEKLDMVWKSQANVAARELAGTHGILRRKDMCSLCGGVRIVTGQSAK